MERRQVDSSMIRSVGWERENDSSSDGHLEVEFKSGLVRQYPATEQEYHDFLRAPSLGKHFNSVFKGRK